MNNAPNHIAIIPDGNRRWAKANLLKASFGHKAGAEKFWDIAKAAHRTGVKYLTIWLASYDNVTKRASEEIEFLKNMLVQEVGSKKFLDDCQKNEINFRVLGEWREFFNDQKLNEAISAAEKATKKFTKSFVTVLFVYDGYREMLDSVKSITSQFKTSISQPNIENLNYDLVKHNLATGFLPQVDLVIRTGGEPHWSAGFMMWLTGNSEFYFTKTLWPDFSTVELKKAIEDFNRRSRKLGK